MHLANKIYKEGTCPGVPYRLVSYSQEECRKMASEFNDLASEVWNAYSQLIIQLSGISPIEYLFHLIYNRFYSYYILGRGLVL